jgi:hypothetical protein
VSTLAINRTVCSLGVVLFGALLAVLLLAPANVEQAAKGYLTTRVKAEIYDRFERPADPDEAEAWAALHKRLAAEAKRTGESLKQGLDKKLAALIARLCHYDCEKRRLLGEAIAAGFAARFEELKVALEKIGQIARGSYARILDALIRDLSIFAGSNLAIFSLLLAVSFLGSERRRFLVLPVSLAVISTVAASLIYIFGQDWFFTILFDRYVGYGYLSYVGVIFAFLADIALLGGAITYAVLDFLKSVLSALANCLGGVG